MLLRFGSPRVLARRAVLGSVAASVAVVGLPAMAQAAAPTTPFISEIHYDDASTDLEEFVEVEFPAGTSSAGWKVFLYNGNGGAVYGAAVRQPLPSVTGPAVAVIDYPVDGLQNGSPDGLALVRPDGTVAEFLSYEGVMTATGTPSATNPAGGMTSTDIGVSEDAVPEGQSLSRRYNTETQALQWFTAAANSKGAVNPTFTPEPVSPCDTAPTHEIGAVQGDAATTPFAGQQVAVRGVVVGDVPGLSGFYLQDVDGDGNPATSDGIFVESGIPVDLGDLVAVEGGARENFNQTQITSREDVEVCEDGDATDLPAPSLLDLPATDAQREPLEGMLVTPDSNLVVSEVFALTRFGELMLAADSVLVQPTEVARPGTAAAAAVAADNALRRIVLDDASNASRSATNRPYLSPETPVRVGDTLAFTAPTVLGYGFSNWRLQPADGDADGTFEGQNTRPAAPDEVGGDVQIGAFNVLNYFISFGPESRGAPNQAELEQQAAKIVPAIRQLDADVVTLMEIEDTDSTGHTPGKADGALADLVGRLNVAEGADVWSFVPLADELYAVDRDVIRSAIIYRNDVVLPLGDSVGLVDEDVWFNAREPIAQTFVKDGDAFTVVANHFKSKSNTTPPQSGNDNADTGQGAFNGDRTRQAASLAAFADELRAGPGGDDVVLMGDFNAYTQEDPIIDLRTAGYADLGEELDPGRYSYVFDALSGSLDHALATDELSGKVTGFAHWNINAVESFAYQYDGDTALYAANPYRSSDHDPLVLGLDLEERCQGLLPTIVGTNGDDVLVGTAGADVIMGLGGNDVLTAGKGEDIVCGGAGNDGLAGNDGEDVLSGGFGDDVLDGGPGDDVLIGGPGTDQLVQGKGEGSAEQEGDES